MPALSGSVIAFCLGAFAGAMIATARARHRNSKYRYAYYATPIIIGAGILQLLLPASSLLLCLYGLAMPVGFLSVVFDPFRPKQPKN